MAVVASSAPVHDHQALFHRVVMAVDFTPASLAAARWATAHLTRGADAFLAHVTPARLLPDCPSTEEASAAAGLAGFGDTLAIAMPRVSILAGTPSSMLDSVVTNTKADLLVIGRRKDSARRRVGEPNVRERVARRTSASVLVVPEGAALAPSHVVAAIDDSSFAELVVRVAAAIARLHDLPLTLLHILPPTSGAYERIIGGSRKSLPQVEPQQHDERVAAPALRFPHITTRIGDAAREIVAVAESHGHALIVVGKRGADLAPIGSLGSVTRTLLGFSSLPVLAVEPSLA